MRGIELSVGVRARIATCALAASIAACTGAAQAQPAAGSTAPSVTPLPSGQGWTATDQNTFYTTGQGSHLIRAAWFKALRQLDIDAPFGADQLQRYGYLAKDDGTNLPIGFVPEKASGQLGLTCAACHTGQIEYVKDNKTYVMRVDGAPASADFQHFLSDLVAAARATLNQPDRFDAFAKAVLGGDYSSASAAKLKDDFGKWVGTFGSFMDISLPSSSPWGPGRLDAFGMIFNRVAGLDLGIVPGNIKTADAPVSYPFLWYASRQDHTQWNGAVENGLDIQGLGRNTGEVMGVFADFTPQPGHLGVPPSFKDNSVDFAGLQALEEMIERLQPPKWPSDLFGYDPKLAAKGGPLFEKNCGRCHDETHSDLLAGAWATPVTWVGTDSKMADNAKRQSNPGIYKGLPLPPPSIGLFTDQSNTKDILARSVVGSLLDEAFIGVTPVNFWIKLRSGVWRAVYKDAQKQHRILIRTVLTPGGLDSLKIIIVTQLKSLFNAPSPDGAYESRVLHGIWATAPYLHNGSVPSLWELMKPPKDRVTSFNVGCRRFDTKNVGFVSDDPSCMTGTFKVDATNGNGNGGHDFGTTLSEDDRWAIVEYLKTY
jgi:hypothetical protein